MKRVVALMLIGLLAGCTSTPQTAKPATTKPGAKVTLSDADRSRVEQDTVASLPDISNASFRTISASTRSDGSYAVCGYVNTTSAAGVQSGDKPFIGVLANGIFTLSAVGGTADETIAVQSECVKNRVYI